MKCWRAVRFRGRAVRVETSGRGDATGSQVGGRSGIKQDRDTGDRGADGGDVVPHGGAVQPGRAVESGSTFKFGGAVLLHAAGKITSPNSGRRRGRNDTGRGSTRPSGSGGEAEAEPILASEDPRVDGTAEYPFADLLPGRDAGRRVYGPGRIRRRGFLRAVIYGFALATLGAGLVHAQDDGIGSGSLWNDREGFRYTNRKATRVGDLITVLVVESSKGNNRSSLSTKKEHKFNAKGGPGSGPFDFIPLFQLDSDIKDQLDGTGNTSVSGQFSTTMTVEVVDIRPNGQLVIEGSRWINLNGEEDRITLHGIARTEDIRSDNTILSTKLAEVRIAYQGKGAGHNATRRGIFQRILGWIF
jgi:flagellar L-ring protein precursor FlgH